MLILGDEIGNEEGKGGDRFYYGAKAQVIRSTECTATRKLQPLYAKPRQRVFDASTLVK